MSAAPDRRALLKERHRAAIVAAARELAAERGADGFSTDDLAARADVARRTVFNHFSSLEDVVVACLEAELAAAVGTLEDAVHAATARAGPLQDLEASLRSADLPAAVSRIARMLADPARAATAERVRHEALRHTAASMDRRLGERYPELPRLQLTLLTSTVMNGVGVVAAEWAERTAPQTTAGPDAAALRLWDELLDSLFTPLRRGFAAPTTTSATSATSTTTEGR